MAERGIDPILTARGRRRSQDRAKSAATSSGEWLLVGVTAFAFAIQCLAIRGPNLGLDGGLSLALAIVPVPDALTFLAHDVHPPLYYLTLRGWLALAGSSPFAAKYLSALLATLTVATFVAWAHRFLGSNAAARGGILLAISPILIGNAATVRDLAAGLFFVTFNCWAYCEALDKSASPRWTYAYLATGLLAIWTSFLAVGVLAAQALHLATRRARIGLLGPIILTGLGIVPWVAFALSRGWLATLGSGGPTTGSVQPALSTDLRMAASLLTTGSDATRGWILALVAALLVVALGPVAAKPMLYERLRHDGRAIFLLFGLGVTSAFALLVTSSWLRLGVPARYLAPALPFWLLLVAALGELVPQWRAWLAVAALAAVNLINLVGWFQQPTLPPAFWNPSAVQRFLDEHLATNDRVVFLTLEQAGYYQALSPRAHSWVAIPVGTSYLERNPTAFAERDLLPLLGSDRTIWLVEYHGVLGSGQRSVEDWLTGRAFPVAPTALSDSDVHPFVTGASLGPDRSVGARFAEGVVLGGAAFPSETHPGDFLVLRLTWHADHPLARDLTVFVHLVDAGGQTIAQQDLRPVGGQAPTTIWRGDVVDRHALTLPTSAPSGAYWLEVGLYDASGRLAVDGRDDGVVRLGPIQIR